MFDEIIACLDGSRLAEAVLPLTNGLTAAAKAKLTLLRVIANRSERSSVQTYLRDRARRYGAETTLLISADPAAAIVAELERKPGAIPAMATQGRTALAETLLGSVALDVVRKAPGPVIVYRRPPTPGDAPKKIRTIAVALDGSKFSERIIPAAVALAKAIGSKLILFQALSGAPAPLEAGHRTPDVLESSYLHVRASRIRREYGVDADWEVLHGDAGDAICRQIRGTKETLLALTSHARAGLSRGILGSVAAECIRNAGVPMLLYWPKD